MIIRKLALLPLVGVLLTFSQVSFGGLILEISEEIVTGGSALTRSTDETSLSADLTNGFGSASLAALRSFNEDTDTGGSSYFNRSAWRLTDLIFSADTPGTSTATVGIGGQLTAALDASVDFGGFTGAGARVKVSYGLFYFDSTGSSFNSGGILFEDSVGAGGFFGPLEESRDIDEFVGITLTLPVDVPVTLSMTLETIAALDVAPGTAISDAANTLTFNTDEFFDIRTSGVTANSGEFLVDNRVPGEPPVSVPEPSILALMGIGLAGLGFARRRRIQD